jgi:hypothetical protein
MAKHKLEANELLICRNRRRQRGRTGREVVADAQADTARLLIQGFDRAIDRIAVRQGLEIDRPPVRDARTEYERAAAAIVRNGVMRIGPAPPVPGWYRPPAPTSSR